jgi:hypothetical protein
MVQCGESINEHVLGAGGMLVADRSAVLRLRLEGAVGFVLYDRRRRRAAAGLFRLEPPHGGGRSMRSRIGEYAETLLCRLVADGGRPEDVEIFALGPAFDGGAPRAPGDLAVGKVLLAYGPAAGGAARTAIFEVASGRMTIEGVADG